MNEPSPNAKWAGRWYLWHPRQGYLVSCLKGHPSFQADLYGYATVDECFHWDSRLAAELFQRDRGLPTECVVTDRPDLHCTRV